MTIGNQYVPIPPEWIDLEPILYRTAMAVLEEARSMIFRAEADSCDQAEEIRRQTTETIKATFHDLIDEMDPGISTEEFDRLFDEKFGSGVSV